MKWKLLFSSIMIHWGNHMEQKMENEMETGVTWGLK